MHHLLSASALWAVMATTCPRIGPVLASAACLIRMGLTWEMAPLESVDTASWMLMREASNNGTAEDLLLRDDDCPKTGQQDY